MPGRIASGLFGGGGGGDFGVVPTQKLTASTPAFNLKTFQTQPGRFKTEFSRLGSDAQRAQEERFPRILRDLDNLRDELTPGFSAVRAVRSAEIANARTRAVGNLRRSLSQRRVLGSSFGEASLASTEREFAEAQASTAAQSFLEELDANQRILALETAQINESLTRELSELGIAAGQTAQLAQLNSANAQFVAQMKAQEAAARGSGLGGLLGLGVGAALTPLGGTALGGLFGAGGGSAVGGSVGGFIPSGDRTVFDRIFRRGIG
jgi:hypothetical protein